MDFFWNRTFLVANLATNFQDLVAKVENLVALAPVLGAISGPEYIVHFFILLKETWKIRDNLYICLLLLTSVETMQLVCIDMLSVM